MKRGLFYYTIILQGTTKEQILFVKYLIFTKANIFETSSRNSFMQIFSRWNKIKLHRSASTTTCMYNSDPVLYKIQIISQTKIYDPVLYLY